MIRVHTHMQARPWDRLPLCRGRRVAIGPLRQGFISWLKRSTSANSPLMMPQGRCRCVAAICLSAASFKGSPTADVAGGTRDSHRKLLSERTYTPCKISPSEHKSWPPLQRRLALWFVLRLSTCFLNRCCQNSLQMNLITSIVSQSRGRSLVYLGVPVGEE